MGAPANIDFWYCCLNPREQGVLRATIEGELLTLFVGVPLAVWDGFWLPYTGDAPAVRAAFMAVYRLKIVTIEVGDPPVPVEVVITEETTAYVDYGIFLLTPGATCSGGCSQSRVP